MACPECGLEQAFAAAGCCARCAAPLPGAGHQTGTLISPGGAEPWLDSSGITIRGKRKARARLLPWEEIGWLRDGWHAPESGDPGWLLHVVLAGGRVKPVMDTWVAGRTQAPPEMLALIRQAAAAHSIAAVLTGGKVDSGLPDVKAGAGLHVDPAGEPGLREWTGTEWSAFLQVDPVASGHPGQENGLARIWSPLSAAVLHRQSRAVLREALLTLLVPVCVAGMGLFLMVFAVMGLAGFFPGSNSPAEYVLLGVAAPVGTLPGALITSREGLALRRLARRLRADAIRMSAQDDPPGSAALGNAPEPGRRVADDGVRRTVSRRSASRPAPGSSSTCSSRRGETSAGRRRRKRPH